MNQAIFYPRAQSYLDRGLRSPFDLYGYLGQTMAGLEDGDEPTIVNYLDASYRHGGGWHDFEGFKLTGWDSDHPRLHYPEDPPTDAVCYWKVGNSRIILFDHAWVVVAKSDTDFRVARMD